MVLTNAGSSGRRGGVMANDPVRYYVSSEDYSSNRIQFGDDIGGNVVFGLHI